MVEMKYVRADSGPEKTDGVADLYAVLWGERSSAHRNPAWEERLGGVAERR